MKGRIIYKYGVSEIYDITLKSPQDYPWGMRENHMPDPDGTFWHFGKNIEYNKKQLIQKDRVFVAGV